MNTGASNYYFYSKIGALSSPSGIAAQGKHTRPAPPANCLRLPAELLAFAAALIHGASFQADGVA